jgi:hypothetical protein
VIVYRFLLVYLSQRFYVIYAQQNMCANMLACINAVTELCEDSKDKFNCKSKLSENV